MSLIDIIFALFGRRRPIPQTSGTNRMEVIGYRKVAEHVYEVTTYSPAWGLVTRKVLVLPEHLIGPPLSGPGS